MDPHERILQGYQKRQVWLRQRILMLKTGKLRCGDSAPLTLAVIARTECQVADIDKAIARLMRGETPKVARRPLAYARRMPRRKR